MVCINLEILKPILNLWNFWNQILSLFQDDHLLENELVLHFTVDLSWHPCVYSKSFHLNSLITEQKIINKIYKIWLELSKYIYICIYIYIYIYYLNWYVPFSCQPAEDSIRTDIIRDRSVGCPCLTHYNSLSDGKSAFSTQSIQPTPGR